MQQLDCCCECHLLVLKIKNIEKTIQHIWDYVRVTGTMVYYLCYLSLGSCRHCC